MDSKIGLIIQLTGVLLITLLTVFLQRSLGSVALRYWIYAWLSLSFALLSLRFAFESEQHAASLYSLYFFGQYLFGYMLVVGCRNLGERRPTGKSLSDLWIVPFGLVPIALPLVAGNFDEMFNIHCLIMSGFFAAAYVTLRLSKIETFGSKVMKIAVGLLSIDLLLYFCVFTAGRFFLFQTDFLQYNSIVDMVLETALGFGMIIVLLEKLLADARHQNEALANAHSQLEALVHTDPLTAAFNRHAFYGFVNKHGGSEPVSGCVGFFDVDNLKEINDSHGHNAGDQAIRAVARAIRELIRAEDLIYRWGGDEFFVIMVGMAAELASVRMESLEEHLTGIRLDGVPDEVSIGVSSGFSDFHGAPELEFAIKEADAEMYKRKEERKRGRGLLGSMMNGPTSGLPRLTA